MLQYSIFAHRLRVDDIMFEKCRIHRQTQHNLYLSGFDVKGRQLSDKEIELLNDWYTKGKITYEVWRDAIRLLSEGYDGNKSAQEAQRLLDKKR